MDEAGFHTRALSSSISVHRDVSRFFLLPSPACSFPNIWVSCRTSKGIFPFPSPSPIHLSKYFPSQGALSSTFHPVHESLQSLGLMMKMRTLPLLETEPKDQARAEAEDLVQCRWLAGMVGD